MLNPLANLTLKPFVVLSLEHMRAKNQFDQFDEVMEYFDLGHAELVPLGELNLPTSDVFYLPMHAVHSPVQPRSYASMKPVSK